MIWTGITLFSFSTAIASDDEDKGQNHIAQLVAEEDDGTKVDPEDIKVVVSPGGDAENGKDEYVFPVTLPTLIF